MTQLTQLTQSTPDITEPLRRVQESLHANRIDLHQADVTRTIMDNYGIERGLAVLKRFEKLNSIKAYYEDRGYGFKIHEFAYNSKTISPEEREKMVTALKEALSLLEFYSRMERDSK